MDQPVFIVGVIQVVLIALGLIGLWWWSRPAKPVAPTPERRVSIRLVSGSGRRDLGTYQAVARLRRPQIKTVGTDGLLGVFLASHRQGETFVYRRVGVERTH